MNKNILIVLGAIVLVVGGVVVYKTSMGDKVDVENPRVETSSTTTTTTTTTTTNGVRIINIIGSEFAFSPSEIRVKKGETVKIVLTNGGKWPHDWVVDEFNARTAIINSGTTEVTFTADKKGTFEYYCSVGTHRAMGMKGNFIVE